MNAKINNIIFDFGGVILNLNESLTNAALCKLIECESNELYEKLNSSNIFYDFECGKISPQIFINHVKSISAKPISDKQVVDAWNAMLLDFPQKHIELLLQLKSKFRTFLLSNTNAIHEAAFTQNLINQSSRYTIYDMFEKVWYSHELGLRKPNHDIFLEVLSQANLKPENTIFLDDRLDNITAASEVGLHTIHITKENGILQIFNEYL